MKNWTFALFVIGFMGLLAFQEHQQVKSVKLTLTVPEAETVVNALSKLPYDQSAGIIQKIISQANTQLADTTIAKPKKN